MTLSIKEKTSTQIVHLNTISIEDESFLMTYCPNLNPVITSMGEIGLMNPIILRGKGQYQVVSGYRRVLAARSLGWNEIRATIYAPDELSVAAGFSLNFYENLGTRRFNLIEAAMVVRGFTTHCGKREKQIREDVLSLLGFQSGNKVLQALQALMFLAQEWKELVVKKEISLLNAAKIASFSLLDQKSLYNVLSELKLGENKLREVLVMAEEICKREKISPSGLFASESFASLGQDGELNTAEKTEQFRKALKARRFPEFTRLEEQFFEYKKKLSLPPQIRLSPPEYFEGDKLKVTFGFRSSEEFRFILEKLETAADNEVLKNLLMIL